MLPRSAYIHVPFCRRRCGYCNFAVVAGRKELIPLYLAALERELSWLERPRPVDTLFLGGGTPTELSPDQLNRLLEIVRRWFPGREGCEFSVEANPGDLTAEKLELLVGAGVNRLSLGVQSFQPEKLRFLQRDHGGENLASCLARCRRRVASMSLDLMFGVPGESLAAWQADLQQALEHQPDHLSLYALTLEKGAAYWSPWVRGEWQLPDEECQRAMYVAARDRLTSGGWEHYEVSNFARPGHRCRHNEVYWTGGEYYAAGPSAARHGDGVREVNHASTRTYVRRVLAGRSPVAERERLDPESKARERLVFQLRMLAGVDLVRFEEETGFDVRRLAGDCLARYEEAGWLELQDGTLRLTREGLLVSDTIWPDLLVC